jgi:predicted DCC family thiol-disulfide oxidoreductase YuxK
VFCSAGMRTILKLDRKGVFRLLPAQTPLGEALYRHYGLDPSDYESNILIEDGVARFKADGTLRMAERLGWPWKIAGAFRVLPGGWLDAAYGLVARNRMKIWGRSDVCYLPQPGQADRVLG